MGRVPWSDLPKELLVFIAKRLDTDIDVLRFRSVCTSWRSSVPLHHNNSSPHFPLQLPVWISPHDRIMNKSIPGFFTLTESTTYQLEPINKNSNWSTSKEASSSSSSSKSTGWLIKVVEAKPGKMRLLNLLSNLKCPIHHHLPQTFHKVLNLLDLRISVISKAYSLNYVDPEYRPVFMCGNHYSISADKVVLSSNLGDYAIMAIHSGGILGFLKAGDEKWTALNDRGPRYEDIINYRGELCAVDNEGRAISIDFTSKLSEIASPICGHGQKKHLVESSGDLLLVDRYLNDRHELSYYRDAEGFGMKEALFFTITVQIKVFKLNIQRREWVEVKSLGDQVLVVGDDAAFSVSARDFAGSKGNCIYFKEEYFSKYNEYDDTLGLRCHGIGVFNLDDGSLGPVASYPGYSSIFRPPPTLVPA